MVSNSGAIGMSVAVASNRMVSHAVGAMRKFRTGKG
jgi:hypothetical protein